MNLFHLKILLIQLPRKENIDNIDETIIEESNEIDTEIACDFSTVHDVSTVQDDSFEIEQNAQPDLSTSRTPSFF